MERGEQEADGDPDRLVHVVVLAFAPVRAIAPRLLEDDDQVGRVGDVRLDPVGADRLDRLQILLARPLLVEELLFVLSRRSDPRLDLGIRDDDERPGLLVRPEGAVAAVRSAFSISSNGTGSGEKCRTERRVRISSRNRRERERASPGRSRSKWSATGRNWAR